MREGTLEKKNELQVQHHCPLPQLHIGLIECQKLFLIYTLARDFDQVEFL